MACGYGIMIDVNLKFCKCGSGELCQNISWVYSIDITYLYMIQIDTDLQN